MERNRIYQMDNLEGMRLLDDACIDLTITSPPYEDLRSYDGFRMDFEATADELYRITKEGGVVVWVVGDKTQKGSESGKSFEQALYFKSIGFRLHDTMIYLKENPMPQNHNRYEQAFEYMFVFSKGRPKTFNPLKEPSKTAGQVYDYSKRGGAATEQEGNPIMRKKKDVYQTKTEKVKSNVWGYLVGMYKSTSDKIAFQHPAIFPEALAQDHILSWSNPGDVVLDPFSGSGTTAKMAFLNDRYYIAFEVSEVYVGISDERLAMARQSVMDAAANE